MRFVTVLLLTSLLGVQLACANLQEVDSSEQPQPSEQVSGAPNSSEHSVEQPNRDDLDKELVDMVRWAFNAVIALVSGALFLFVIFVGANWYQSNRKLKDERDSLEKDLKRFVSDELKEARISLRDIVDDRIESKLFSLRGELHELKLKQLISTVKERLDGDAYFTDYALDQCSQAFELTKTAHHGFMYVSDLFTLIPKVVKKLVKDGEDITPSSAERLFTALDQLENHSVEVDRIKGIVVDARGLQQQSG